MLEINGIRYRDSNQKAVTGAESPIVFLHGFPFESSMWDEVIAGLQVHYRCIAPDIRGLGESQSLAGPVSMDDYVDDLFQLMEELQLNKPIIVGLSMGGYIALRALEREQEKFSKAILFDTKSQPDADTARINRFKGMATIRNEGLAPFVEGFVPPTLHRENRRSRQELMNRLIQKAETFPKTGVMNALMAMAARTDTTPFLKQIRIPTLLIVGEGDELTTPAIMNVMQTEIPGSRLATIPGAGHLPPLENPQATLSTMLEFLNG